MKIKQERLFKFIEQVMDGLPTKTNGLEDRLLLLAACLQFIPCVETNATGNNNVKCFL